MNNNTASDQTTDETLTTGLPWPKSWNGAYLFVIVTFVFWIVLLVALGEIHQ